MKSFAATLFAAAVTVCAPIITAAAAGAGNIQAELANRRLNAVSGGDRAASTTSGVYTLNVTTYQYSDCTGTPTFYVVTEGECVRTQYGMLSVSRPSVTPPLLPSPSSSAAATDDTATCLTEYFCGSPVTHTVVCGACNGWAANANSYTTDCHLDTNTVDFHWYSNMDRRPERCTYDQSDTLQVPVGSPNCTYVNGMGPLKLRAMSACKVVGFSLNAAAGATECGGSAPPASLSTVAYVVPSSTCADGIMAYRNTQ